MSPPRRPRVQWAKRHEFAEVAEVLGVNTDQLMGMMEDRGVVIALFSPEDRDPPVIWRAILRRNAIGILEVDTLRAVPGLWQEIVSNLDDHMRGFRPEEP